MQTIKQFIDRVGVTMEATRVPENPHMTGENAMPAGSVHFNVVIRVGDAHMTSYYSVGPGIVDRWAESDAAPSRVRKEYKHAAPWRAGFTSLLQEGTRDNAAKVYKPDLADVLSCLAMDAAGLDNSTRFESWAWEHGYDTDSRRAESIFKACCATADDLRRVMGAEYESLVYETESE